MSVSRVAQVISERFGYNVRPRDISLLIYDREINVDHCPIEAGRRMIPESLIPQVVSALRRRGKLGSAA